MGGLAWLLLFIALGGVAAHAQDEVLADEGAVERTEPKEAAEQEANTAQDEPPPAEAQPAKPESTTPAETKPSPEVFVPTEDISEDLSVRFPVDI